MVARGHVSLSRQVTPGHTVWGELKHQQHPARNWLSNTPAQFKLPRPTNTTAAAARIRSSAAKAGLCCLNSPFSFTNHTSHYLVYSHPLLHTAAHHLSQQQQQHNSSAPFSTSAVSVSLRPAPVSDHPFTHQTTRPVPQAWYCNVLGARPDTMPLPGAAA